MTVVRASTVAARRHRHRLQVTASFSSAVIMLAVGIAAVFSLGRAVGSERWVEQSHVVRDRLADVRASLSRADIAARSYVATGDPRTLREFRESADEIRAASLSLHETPFDFPAERRAASLLHERTSQALELLEALVASKSSAKPRRDDAHVAERTEALAGVLEAVALLRRTEDAQLESQRATLRDQLFVTQWVIVAGTGFSALVALAAAFTLRRTFRQRNAAEAGLSVRAAELERALVQRAQTLDELRAGEREREKLIEQLERTNRDLDQFAYVTSHDLKAPLRGIANLAEWIREDLPEDVLPADTRHHLELMHDRVQRMEALIDAILKYSRAGRVDADPEDVDLGDLVRETVDLVAPSDDVDVRIASDMPQVFAHRLILQQGMLNLINNAVKFADDERPVVQIDWHDAGDHIDLCIRDNGPGIDPAYQSQIFKLFQTLGKRESQEGTGIGLAVVKKIAQVAGGSVRVVSQPGDGATFILRWPKRATKRTKAEYS